MYNQEASPSSGFKVTRVLCCSIISQIGHAIPRHPPIFELALNLFHLEISPKWIVIGSYIVRGGDSLGASCQRSASDVQLEACGDDFGEWIMHSLGGNSACQDYLTI